MANARSGAAATIDALMRQRRVTQQDMAGVLGLPQSQVSKRLSGHIEWSESELRAVAAYLEVPAGSLLEPPVLLVEEAS